MKVREIVLCALFIALVAVGAFIRIPVGTDVYTLQFLFTLLAGVLLGARLGAFGYLVGFICQAYLTGALVRGGEPTFGRVLGACLAGMAVVYLFGISYFYIASNYIVDAPITLWLALWYCGILQVVPDFLLCLAAAFIGIRCRKAGLWL